MRWSSFTLHRALAAALLLGLSSLFTSVVGEDWPQWRGPRRDNVSTEAGLLQEWPGIGPPLVWRANKIGEGIASVAIEKGTVYTLGSSGEHEHVIAL